MSYKPRSTRSAVACVEMMEPRQLLSASLAPAHKTPPPIPSIAGEVFTGAATHGRDHVALTVTFGTETTKGGLTASVLFDGATLSSTGTIKSTRAVTFQGKFGKIHFVLHGKINSTLDTITGKYTDSDSKGSVSGPFSLTKTV